MFTACSTVAFGAKALAGPISLLDAGPANAHTCAMTEQSGPAGEPGNERPRAGRVLQGLLIVAIMVLIAIAVVTFR